MKTLKIVGIVVLVLVVLFFGIAMFLPSEVHVERSLVIPASSEIVFKQINDLRKWKEWSPWHRMDPDMKIMYEDFLSGEGASYRWESNKLGNGKLTITDSQPFQYIETEMDFMEQGTAMGYYRLEPVEEGTEVTWGFEADMGNGPIKKYMGLMMDSMIGSDFEKGLQNLKTYVKNLPKDAMTKEAS